MLKWFPCEMHCHTLHSDGKFTVESLMQTAKEYGPLQTTTPFRAGTKLPRKEKRNTFPF